MSIFYMTKNWRCHKVSTIVFFNYFLKKAICFMSITPHFKQFLQNRIPLRRHFKIVKSFHHYFLLCNDFSTRQLDCLFIKTWIPISDFKQICRGGGAVDKSICPARGRWDFESQPRQTYVNKRGKDSSNAKRLSTGVTRLRTLTV